MSGKTPNVSVIMPCYNSAASIGRALDSVIGQTFSDYEIIVVDDGSSDDSAGIVRKYPRTTYLKQQNGGPAKARNAGIGASRGRFIAFLDADDRWHPDKLKRCLAELDSDPETGMVFTDVAWIDKKGVTIRPKVMERIDDDRIREKLSQRCFIVTSTVVVRKEVFGRIGLFDESLMYGEDWDLFYRISRRYRVRMVNEPLTEYTFTPTGMTRDRQRRARMIADNLKLVDRLYSYPENLAKQAQKKRYLARYHRDIGDSELYEGYPEEARRHLRRSLSLEPVNLRTHLLLLKSFFWKMETYGKLRSWKTRMMNQM